MLPGFIDGHLHSSETLFKGLAQDVPESEWMHKTIDPFTSHLTEKDMIKGARLAVLEGIDNGTTTFADYSYPLRPVLEEVYLPLKLRTVAVPKVYSMPSSKDDVDSNKQYQLDEKRGERLFKEACSRSITLL